MKTFIWFVLILAAAALLLSAPTLVAQASQNFGLVSALKAPDCDPDWFVCQNLPAQYPPIQYPGNQAALQKARGYLEQAFRWQPESDSLRLHLAEMAFAYGDRQKAAQYLQDIRNPDPNRSPLLQDQRYESRLIKARNDANRKDWNTTIYDYRLGLAWGDERTLPVDEQDYFLALAEMEKVSFEQNPQDAQSAYRIGRYLAQAGEWDSSNSWLNRALQMAGLTNRQSAWASYILGRNAEMSSNWRDAYDYYNHAMEFDPRMSQPYFRTIILLDKAGQKDQVDEIKKELLALGPNYLLGAQGESYLALKPAIGPNDWVLVGYDLDEEMLELAKSLELTLWWKSENEQPQKEGWIKVGDYWLQEQRMINLFPNAGLEWGVDKNGIPLGQDREYYQSPPGSMSVLKKVRGGQLTSVAAANNSSLVRQVALISRKIPVDAKSYYLMAGQILDEGGSATIGRTCSGGQQEPISPYYIIGYQGQPLSQWVSYSDLNTAYPEYEPTGCESLLMNDANSNQPAFWDNILWMRLENP